MKHARNQKIDVKNESYMYENARNDMYFKTLKFLKKSSLNEQVGTRRVILDKLIINKVGGITIHS